MKKRGYSLFRRKGGGSFEGELLGSELQRNKSFNDFLYLHHTNSM